MRYLLTSQRFIIKTTNLGRGIVRFFMWSPVLRFSPSNCFNHGVKKAKMNLFVWDFHGVLEKGNDLAVHEITNIALAKFGHLKKMTVAESVLLSGLRWHEYFAYLLPNHNKDEHLKLQSSCFEISQNQPEIVSKHIQINDYADYVLDSIQQSGHNQILISNTLPKSLDMFVKIVGIEKYFPPSHRFGVDSHHQKYITKKHCLNDYLKDKIGIKKIISIGDSPSDMALIENTEEIDGVSYLYSHPDKEHRGKMSL
jgi:phosphoglycolate phosphatase-like HAD superfamily hydrolase